MKEPKNVVYLQDYIAQRKDVSFSNNLTKQESLLEPKSELFKRVIAFGVDLMAIGIFKISMYTAYALFLNEFMSPLGEKFKAHLLDGNIVTHLSVYLLIYYSYFLFCNFVLSGKTLGKLAMGLRVINEKFCHDLDDTDYELTLSQCFKRSTGYLLCYLSFGTFFIFNFSSEDHRGLADYLSSSRTVSDSWLTQMLDYKEHQREQVTIEIKSLELVA